MPPSFSRALANQVVPPRARIDVWNRGLRLLDQRFQRFAALESLPTLPGAPRLQRLDHGVRRLRAVGHPMEEAGLVHMDR